MTPKISKLFDELEQDLRLTGLEPFADRLVHLKKSLTPLQKKSPVKGIALKLEITENGRTNEIIFQSEKEAEKYLVLKQKERLKSAKSPEGLTVPNLNSYGGTYASRTEEYNRDCAAYWQVAAQQGTDFTVKISKA